MTNERKEMRRIFHDGRVQWGTKQDDVIILGDGQTIPCQTAQHLAPVSPSKIICVHLNYDSRRIEFRSPEPEQYPSYFQKPTTSINTHDGVLFRPRGAQFLNYEGEIGVIIGAEMRNVSQDAAWAGIAGYAPANDVGCHDFRDIDRNSMLRVKGMDGFCPIGPGIVSGIDIRESTLRTYINGSVVQETLVSDMSFDIGYLISDLSRYITLLPGDLILSGTPENSRPMNIGDVVEVEVTGVGRLRNTVAEAPEDVIAVGFPPTASQEVRRVALGSDFYLT